MRRLADEYVLPARAGMSPTSASASCGAAGAPRACGDEPTSTKLEVLKRQCSPRVRGGAPGFQDWKDADLVLPARAGMSPERRLTANPTQRAPRACGDEPRGASCTSTGRKCSPRVRG